MAVKIGILEQLVELVKRVVGGLVEEGVADQFSKQLVGVAEVILSKVGMEWNNVEMKDGNGIPDV